MKYFFGVFLLTVSLLAEPVWVKHPTGKDNKAVGIAENYFPQHEKKRVAFIRARQKLFDTGIEQNLTQFIQSQNFEVLQQFEDEKGNFFLLLHYQK